MTPLPDWCARLLGDFSRSDARAGAIARRLTPDTLNWKPRPDAWSVGQCLEHLTLGNEVYLDAIEAALTRNIRPAPAREILPGAPSRWFIRAFIAPSEKTRRATAPRLATPPSTVDPAVLDRFLRSNERARAMIRRAADYDVNRIRFKNPFVSLIRFTVGTGFEILARHEDRHLLQAERVASSAGFPHASFTGSR